MKQSRWVSLKTKQPKHLQDCLIEINQVMMNDICRAIYIPKEKYFILYDGSNGIHQGVPVKEVVVWKSYK